MRILYFDCFCGASGDMLVGALIDVGANFDAIRDSLRSLPVDGFDVEIKKVNKKGILATQFQVKTDPTLKQPHRHFSDIAHLIEKSSLPNEVKENAIKTFRLIAEAEAQVHGTTIEKIHFHEVGAIDSIVDIVGTHLAIHFLKPEKIYSTPLIVGSGTVSCDHGVMPVPAPATALLLQGIPWSSGEVHGELVTPTGAALLRTLVSEFRPISPINVEAVGYGSGSRDLADRANVLRVFLGTASTFLCRAEEICIVETNIDDMSPELLAPIITDVFHLGARDAFWTPVVGKKGRAAYLITVLCDREKLSAIVNLFFQSTSTFGVRVRTEQRFCLDRKWKIVHTHWGDIRIKLGYADDNIVRKSPEFEDCRAIAERHNVSILDVYQQALALAVKGEMDDVE